MYRFSILILWTYEVDIIEGWLSFQIKVKILERDIATYFERPLQYEGCINDLWMKRWEYCTEIVWKRNINYKAVFNLTLVRLI